MSDLEDKSGFDKYAPKTFGRDPHVLLRVISKFLIPLIALFAFYVQFHGDYGPGGGFQAGVILAASVILYALIFGLPPNSIAGQHYGILAVELGVLITVTTVMIAIFYAFGSRQPETSDEDW